MSVTQDVPMSETSHPSSRQLPDHVDLGKQATNDTQDGMGVGRQATYDRQDEKGAVFVETMQRLRMRGTRAGFRFVARWLVMIVKGICVGLRVPVSEGRVQVVADFDRILQWHERSYWTGVASPTPLPEH